MTRALTVRREEASSGSPCKALVAVIPGRGAVHGALDVYRDGEAYVLVGRVGGVRKAKEGPGNVELGADVFLRVPTRAALESELRAEMLKDPERYTRLVGAFGVDERIEDAPEIPESLKAAIDGRRGLSLAAVGEAALALPAASRPSVDLGEVEDESEGESPDESGEYEGPRVELEADYEVLP
jgi:hypothetical protein